MLRRDFIMHLGGLGLSGAAPLKAVGGMLGIAEDGWQQAASADAPGDPLGSAVPRDIRVIGVGGAGRHFIDKHCWGFGWTLITAERESPWLCSRSALHDVDLVLTRRDIDIVLGSIPNSFHRDTDKTATKFDAAKIHLALQGADVVIVIAGLGGRTGNHIGPVAADTARRLGAFTIGIGITPFEYEGPGIYRRGQEALALLRRNADVAIEISNQRQAEILWPDDFYIDDCFMHGERPVAEFLASHFSCSGQTDLAPN